MANNKMLRSIAEIVSLLLIVVSLASLGRGEQLHRFSLIPKRKVLKGAARHLRFFRQEEIDDLHQGFGTHYVRLDVGCPRQEQTVIVDTGSSAIGFPCAECESCGDGFQLNENFQQHESSCFRQIQCRECSIGYCNRWGTCSVGRSYVEGSSWFGYEAEDQVAVGGTPEEEQFSLRFACQTRVTGFFQTQLADGILGMGKGEGSLWQQMFNLGEIDKEQFSLCYSYQEEAEANAGVMVLGGADSRLHDIPMTFAKDTGRSSWFGVTVMKIYLRKDGGTSVISNNANATIQDIGIVSPQHPIVDSGTTDTYLNRNLRESFEQAWVELTGLPLNRRFYLTEEEMLQLPTILFQVSPSGLQNPNPGALAGDLDPLNPSDILIAFPPTRYLEKGSGSYYTRYILFSEIDDGVLGANFISGHDVNFDTENGRIGFAESTCNREVIDWNATTTASPTTFPSSQQSTDAPTTPSTALPPTTIPSSQPATDDPTASTTVSPATLSPQPTTDDSTATTTASPSTTLSPQSTTAVPTSDKEEPLVASEPQDDDKSPTRSNGRRTLNGWFSYSLGLLYLTSFLML